MSGKVLRSYRYVGPDNLHGSNALPAMQLTTHGALLRELQLLGIGPSKKDEKTVTFIVDIEGYLRVAYRQSEHLRCAGGADVLSAGEVTFAWTGAGGIAVDWITNQSTGYCPEPESWSAVEIALRQVSIIAPSDFSVAMVFRRCERCKQTNIVKNDFYFCDVCSYELPREWNFGNPCY